MTYFFDPKIINSPYKIKMAIGIAVILSCLAISSGRAHAEEISAILAKDIYRHAWFGLTATDVHTGEILSNINGHRLVYPASLTKLFGSATALAHLGPDFTFDTVLYRRGHLDETGTLTGDLIVQAGGDAFFSGMDNLVKGVKSSGIKQVTGEIIVDDRLFEPYHAYSVVIPGQRLYTISPAMTAQSHLTIRVSPTRPNGKSRLEIRPLPTWPSVMNSVETVPGEGEDRVTATWVGGSVLRTEGHIYAKSKPGVMQVAIADPAGFFRALFIHRLRHAGIRVAASPRRENPRHLLPAPDAYERILARIALHRSLPLSLYVKRILETSNNPGADALLCVMGARRGPTKSLAGGLAVVRDFLRAQDTDLKSLALTDGAGISPANLVTPQAVAQFLRALTQMSIYPQFYDALPIMGISGTLASAVGDDSPLRGNVRAKTGTMNQYDTLNSSGFTYGKGMAGYLHTKSGRFLAFCAVFNHVHVSWAEQVTDVRRLADEVARDLVRITDTLYRTF